jgi:hypothetical protein
MMMAFSDSPRLGNSLTNSLNLVCS